MLFSRLSPIGSRTASAGTRPVLVAGAVLVAAALVAAAPTAAAAQSAPDMTGTISGDLHGGVAIPAGGLAHVTSTGGAVGGGLMYRFLPNVGVRADLSADLMSSTHDSLGNKLPSLKLLHLTAGLQFDVPAPDWRSHPVSAALRVGAGITHISTNHQLVTGPLKNFAHTYFTVMSGVRLGWQLNRYVNLFASADAFLALGNSADAVPFTQQSPQVALFKNYWTFPLSLGAQVTIP